MEEIYYYPFGQTRVDSGSVNLHYKYTGQEEDAEIGLYFYGARYYDPAIGRFVSADTLVQNFSDPQTLNRYSYARNNPLYYVDPSGHLFVVDDIVIGAVIGAAIGGITAGVQGQNIGKGMLYGAIGGAFTGGAAGYGFVAQVGAGSASGGLTSAISGGDIGKGMLYGAVGGAAGYGIGQVGFSNEYLQFGSQVVGGGLVGGGLADLSGGKFSEGFMSGAIGAAAGYGIGKFMEWNSTQNDAKVKQAEAEGNLTVNHSDIKTPSEDRIALGPFGPGLKNVNTSQSELQIIKEAVEAYYKNKSDGWGGPEASLHRPFPGQFGSAGLSGGAYTAKQIGADWSLFIRADRAPVFI
ncbi:MAG: RHS repeat-associated core domain-containing protein [Armatimonadota bacterium]